MKLNRGLIKRIRLKVDFNKTYDSPFNESLRENIFWENLKTISHHNYEFLRGRSTFKMGINQFADITLDEIMLKFNQSEEDELKLSKLKIVPTIVLNDENFEGSIPSSFDWRDRGAVTKVKNQKQCGSCYAFSSVGSIESQNFIQNGKLVELSEQEIVDCASDYGGFHCDGGIPSSGIEYVKYKGISLSADYPYEGKKGDCRASKNKIKMNIKGFGVVKTRNDEKSLMKALVEIGPMDVGFDAEHDSFMRYSGGIYNEKNCTSTLNHGVLLIGYGSENGVDFWIAKNSYGETWGESGFFRIARNLGSDCGITLHVLFPVIHKTLHKTTTKASSSVSLTPATKSFTEKTKAEMRQRTTSSPPSLTSDGNFLKTTTRNDQNVLDSSNLNLTDEYLQEFMEMFKANLKKNKQNILINQTANFEDFD